MKIDRAQKMCQGRGYSGGDGKGRGEEKRRMLTQLKYDSPNLEKTWFPHLDFTTDNLKVGHRDYDYLT